MLLKLYCLHFGKFAKKYIIRKCKDFRIKILYKSSIRQNVSLEDADINFVSIIVERILLFVLNCHANVNKSIYYAQK